MSTWVTWSSTPRGSNAHALDDRGRQLGLPANLFFRRRPLRRDPALLATHASYLPRRECQAGDGYLARPGCQARAAVGFGHGDHHKSKTPRGYVLLLLHVAVAGQEDLEASIHSHAEQHTVDETAPPHTRDGRPIVSYQLTPKRAWHTLIKQNSHSESKTPRRISSAAIACSRFTLGKLSRYSSRLYPPSSQSTRLTTGTRVPLKAASPPSIPGSRDTSTGRTTSVIIANASTLQPL